MVTFLQEQSAKRVEASPEFQKINKEIATFLQRKNRKHDLAQLRDCARRSGIQDKIEEKKAEEVTSDEQPDGPIFPSPAITTKSCGSALDYLQFCARID